MANQKKRLAVLASGSGTNLQAIIDSIKENEIENAEIAIVISNKENSFALKRAEKENIKNLYINTKDFTNSEGYNQKIVEILNIESIDLVVLAGYLKILSKTFIEAYKQKIINIHPSLLPKFGGKGMYGHHVHEAVINAHEKESGCTVHYVTEGIDEGNIICQSKIQVLPNDNVDTLAKKVLEKEHKLLIDGINKVLKNKAKVNS